MRKKKSNKSNKRKSNKSKTRIRRLMSKRRIKRSQRGRMMRVIVEMGGIAEEEVVGRFIPGL